MFSRFCLRIPIYSIPKFSTDVSQAADLSWKIFSGLETGDALGFDPHSVIHQCFGLLSTPDGYSAPVCHFFLVLKVIESTSAIIKRALPFL